jgi:ATP-dependent helicase HrpB
LAANAFAEQVRSRPDGDVLIFMPGGFEISQTIEAIRQRPESRGYLLLPLHGELAPHDQDAAVARYERPKVVVATNVAETSITIDGVRLVIDSGLARIPRYDPNRGINSLLVDRISQASADQRAGRAGRTAPGRCARLWSRDEHQERPPQELPEIKRLDLAEVILTLKAAGVEDLRQFRWLEAPSEIALHHAEVLLLDLGALTRRGHEDKESSSSRGPGPAETLVPARTDSITVISPIGRRMLAFPVHPRYARMLLAAQEFGCVPQACLVAALTQGRDLLVRNAGREAGSAREDLFGEKGTSDFWILMRAWNYAVQNQFRPEPLRKLGIHIVTARQVGPLYEQFLRIAREEGLEVSSREVKDESLQKCILIGFSDRLGRRLDQGTLRCELVHGRRGVLARESVVQASSFFVAAEIREVGGRDGDVNTILSLATAVEIAWLRELFPEDLNSELDVTYDASSKRVQAAEILRFRDLVLTTRRVEPPPPEAAARLLTDEVVAGRLALPNWDHGVEQWLLRLELLGGWCPELQLPPIGEEEKRHLVEQLCHGAVSYKDLKEREVKPVVKSWLSPAQQEFLDKHAPERVSLPNGRTPKVIYDADGPPYISLRIQELYDVTQSPRIAMGRVPLSVHILSPGMKPVQVTQDMASFWKEHYPRLKSELQRKYPKHEWR